MLFAVACLLVGCRSEFDFLEGANPGGDQDIIYSGGNIQLLFSSAAGSESVSLKASKKWTASFTDDRAKDWCSLSLYNSGPGTATVKVSVKENTGYDERSASIAFECDDIKRTISVTQKQKDALLVSGSRFEIGKEGGLIEIEVKANIKFDYTVSEDSQAWIKPITTRGLSSSVVDFAIAPNEALAAREGEILFSGISGTEKVKVYQDGESPAIILGTGEYRMGPEGGLLDIGLRSNMDLQVEVGPEGCDWIAQAGTKTLTERTHSFSVSRNHTRSARSGWIAFCSPGQNCSDTVLVVQDFQPILAQHDTLKASARGWTVSFETVGPDPSDYQVLPVDDWLSPAAQETVSGRSRFSVLVSEQEDRTTPRLGRILVYAKDYDHPDTVLVSQIPLPSFSFTTTAGSRTMPAIEGEIRYGFVFWGDETRDLYAPDMSHTFRTSGMHTVTVEVSGAKRVSISGLEDGMTVDFREMHNR